MIPSVIPLGVRIGAVRATPCQKAETFGQLPLVVLKGGKKKMMVGDTPAVTLFPGAIDCVIARPPPSTGDPVLVVDGTRESVLAYGVYNPESTFAVRILEFYGKNDFDGDTPYPEEYLDDLIRSRVHAAADLRTATMGLNKVTSAWRLCNAEGDYLPGLIVDVFGEVAVVQSSAAWIEARRDVVTGCLEDRGFEVIWRPAVDMLALEGLDVDAMNAVDAEGKRAPRKIIVEEHGIKFHVDTGSQKTGFYCDQRDNRRKVGTMAEGKSVVDICCYSGGFGIYAAVGGASRVVGVDSSQQAVDLAAANAVLNNVDSVCEFVRKDASDWMDEAIKAGEKFDIVILDPPKLAPNRKSLANATRKVGGPWCSESC